MKSTLLSSMMSGIKQLKVMSKEKISLTKGELESILAHAMGYVWNELSTDMVKVSNGMEVEA